MAAVGGSVRKVTIDSRIFAVAADADANLDTGGEVAEQQPNGNGTTRKTLTRKPWSIDGLSLEIDHSKGDLEFLQDRADSPDNVPISIELAGGITWRGKGCPTGDIKASTANATAPITLSGPGKLTRG